ncbi:hypothetical protein Rhe02_44720 [Rhizocola hellebori]|uniref:Uncharacterized protein n=1 Tax=Rhizocola hellebori TaxID=1392758 RepID=A0A8J3Q9H4_9ACTN|nr:hypothetical protein [Rhizocola hellebori]GIH06405.1 hypothetical protein Rhe02_44720 [Rhizocola hellebori]
MDQQAVGTLAQVFVGLLIALAIEFKTFGAKSLQEFDQVDVRTVQGFLSRRTLILAFNMTAATFAFLGVASSSLGLLVCVTSSFVVAPVDNLIFATVISLFVAVSVVGASAPPLARLVVVAVQSPTAFVGIFMLAGALVGFVMAVVMVMAVGTWLLPLTTQKAPVGRNHPHAMQDQSIMIEPTRDIPGMI